MFRFKSARGTVAVKAVSASGSGGGGEGTDRRASPLWVHFQTLANGRIATVLTWLKGPFMPGFKLLAGRSPLAMPDGRIIGEFFDALDCRRWSV